MTEFVEKESYEVAVYNSEDGKWYRLGDDPWCVRDVPKDRIVRPLVSAVADTYAEAFEKLFGHTSVITPPVRAPRHAEGV